MKTATVESRISAVTVFHRGARVTRRAELNGVGGDARQIGRVLEMPGLGRPEIAKQAILVQIDIFDELRGTTKEKDATIRLYENLVARFQRSSYP